MHIKMFRPSYSRTHFYHFLGKENADEEDQHIPFHLLDYIDLIEWTGKAILDNKRGSIPVNIHPTLQTLGITESNWLNSVKYFGSPIRRHIDDKSQHIWSYVNKVGGEYLNKLADCYSSNAQHPT